MNVYVVEIEENYYDGTRWASNVFVNERKAKRFVNRFNMKKYRLNEDDIKDYWKLDKEKDIRKIKPVEIANYTEFKVEK